ncbi:MAG: hypothetical protein AAGF47_10190 [Planctomycetota bacterium]
MAIILVVLASLLALPTVSQPEAQPEQESLLGGPAIEAAAERPTLVERDYEGKLRPLERRAEYLAVGLLGLTDAERADADAIIEERAALADSIVFDNLSLLTELQAARSGGDERAGWLGGDRDLRRRVLETVRPMMAQEPMADRIADALPAEARNEYRRLVDEYNEAFNAAQSDRQAQRPAGREGARRGIRTGGQRFAETRQRLRAVGQEIKSAYERGASARQADLESFLSTLELRPEQEGEVREIIRRGFEQSIDSKPTQEQRAAVIREVIEKLDPDQRRRLNERLMDARRG